MVVKLTSRAHLIMVSCSIQINELLSNGSDEQAPSLERTGSQLHTRKSKESMINLFRDTSMHLECRLYQTFKDLTTFFAFMSSNFEMWDHCQLLRQKSNQDEYMNASCSLALYLHKQAKFLCWIWGKQQNAYCILDCWFKTGRCFSLKRWNLLFFFLMNFIIRKTHLLKFGSCLI